MSLETFTPPNAPDVSSSGSHKFRILKAGFGDAYSQRAADGINPKESSYSFAWTKATQSEIENMKTFLDARGGHEAFYYTIPNGSTPLKFTCENYSEIWEDGALKGLSVTFERVYDL
jgi:phage-related protein